MLDIPDDEMPSKEEGTNDENRLTESSEGDLRDEKGDELPSDSNAEPDPARHQLKAFADMQKNLARAVQPHLEAVAQIQQSWPA